MSWRDVQELRVYFPSDRYPDINWVNEIVGKVVKPIVDTYEFRWIWVTRYIELVSHAIPPAYEIRHNNLNEVQNAYIRFRLSVEDKSAQHHARELAQAAGYHTSAWEHYAVVDDLGSNRFIYAEASDSERVERAHHIAMFMSSTTSLLVHSLREDRGKWMIESNSDRENNPDNSFFQSVHHLFCNTTEVPLFIDLHSLFYGARARIRF